MKESMKRQPDFELPRRQVNLDFHTSGSIEQIGAQFSKEDFQNALRLGNVNSVTMFAKCHHGYCYYPTRVGTMHPHLEFDLLGQMLDAAHEIGVRAPIYITAGWSALDARRRPDWRARTADGEVSTVCGCKTDAPADEPKPEDSWINLCLNDGSYTEHIYELTREICDRYERIDGVFFDICFFIEACYCDECQRGMRAMGLDPARESDAKRYFVVMHNRFMEKCREIVAEKHPDASVFFNGGAEIQKPQYHANQTHFELEDLPTAWGGYDKMPLRAKYFSKSGKQYLGMTGKFHRAWGEFGGFKAPQALRYEIAAMMAFGAGGSVGDQMHPSGVLDLETYRLIGQAYDYARAIEPYCFMMEPVSKLGLYLSRNQDANEGVTKALLDAHEEFDVITGDDFGRYETVLIPEGAGLNENAQQRLREYLQNGGRLLLLGDSLLQENGPLVDIGCGCRGPARSDIDYLLLNRPALEPVLSSPFLMYRPAMELEASNDRCEVLAQVVPPYFNRTYGHYCGHKNTPYDLTAPRRPAAVRRGGVVYAAHPLGTIYKMYGSEYHRRYFEGLLRLACPNPVAKVSLPSAGRISFGRQAAQGRYCLHLLYAQPAHRGSVDVIEDIVPVYDTNIRLRIPEKVRSVEAFPSGESVSFHQDGEYVDLVLPFFEMHTVVVLNFDTIV